MATPASGPPDLLVRIPSGTPFVEEPTAINRTREIIAYLLLVMFGLTLVGSLVYVGSEDSWARAKEFLQIALPAEIGLLGGAIGFYFASEKADSGLGGGSA